MASMRDIKRRIKSVNSTKQITQAMNLVASSKLQKARQRLLEVRPFFDETKRVISDIVNNSAGVSHPFLSEREVKSVAIITIAGDRGLCGGYNANVSKEAFNFIKDKNNASVITVGTKSRDFFRHRKVNILESYMGISEKPDYSHALKIGKKALDLFTDGSVDEVYLAYTKFNSTISHEPTLIRLLPVDVNDFKEETSEGKKASQKALTIYDPDEESVLEYVIPKYLNTVVFGALVESAACELGARMTAMDAATENAEDVIDGLTLAYNRARQGAITQEITEIVSGANALE